MTSNSNTQNSNINQLNQLNFQITTNNSYKNEKRII